MYHRIIKKDLKRKKTMNIILLLFIILATTFIASSINNLISISTALPNYFDKAKLYDYIIMTSNNIENDDNIVEFLNENKEVKSWVVDENISVSSGSVKLENGEKFIMNSTCILSSYNIKQQIFFDSKNNEISNINDGDIYIPTLVMEENNLEPGDRFTIEYDEFSVDFTIKDSFKDAFLGSPMMGIKRFIVSDKDYNKIYEYLDPSFRGRLFSINTYDLQEFKRNYNQESSISAFVACDKSMISTTYIMDMMIAAILLVVSVCLIIISFVILRFTILFSLQEEYREIGVMKAIGIRSRRIRGIYIIKYLAISTMGSLIGFFASIPFGRIFINQVSKNIIITDYVGGRLINVICSAFILIIIMVFSYSCTYRIGKFSPVRAIRNGSEGERYKRKAFLKLSKTSMPTVLYLAINNILSAPKRFATLVITFTIGIILVIVPINIINTLGDEGLVTLFGVAESDVYMVNNDVIMKFMSDDGRSKLKSFIDDMELNLMENGINATVSCEMTFQYKIKYQDNNFTSLALQGTGITADQYLYTSGEPPMYPNEVAITHIIADEIGASIGDTVSMNTASTHKDYIVTAIYQSMNNMGAGVRFSEMEELDYSQSTGGMLIQVKYLDEQKKEENYIDKIKSLYPNYEVKTGSDYIGDILSDITVKLEGTKKIIIGVIILINILVAVLMVKTFIAKEMAEIGLLKSTGFRNSSIIKWQVIRIGIILIISMILGIILSNPVMQVTGGKAFGIMGASHIEFVIKPLEIYVLYPMLIFVLTLFASTLTALQVGWVSTQETHNIE